MQHPERVEDKDLLPHLPPRRRSHGRVLAFGVDHERGSVARPQQQIRDNRRTPLPCPGRGDGQHVPVVAPADLAGRLIERRAEHHPARLPGHQPFIQQADEAFRTPYPGLQRPPYAPDWQRGRGDQPPPRFQVGRDSADQRDGDIQANQLPPRLRLQKGQQPRRVRQRELQQLPINRRREAEPPERHIDEQHSADQQQPLRELADDPPHDGGGPDAAARLHKDAADEPEQRRNGHVSGQEHRPHGEVEIPAEIEGQPRAEHRGARGGDHEGDKAKKSPHLAFPSTRLSSTGYFL